MVANLRNIVFHIGEYILNLMHFIFYDLHVPQNAQINLRHCFSNIL